MYEGRKSTSEVDLMSGRLSLDFHRGIERQWARCMKSPGRIRGQIVALAERTLPSAFNNKCSLIPIPVRTIADRARLDGGRPHD